MSLAALRTEPEHDPSQVRERAEDLLSRPPYTEESPGLLARAWERLTDWVAEQVGGLLEVVAGDAGIAWLVVAVGVAVLLVVVWRATRGLSIDRAVGEEPTTGSRGRQAREWARDADEHEEAGRWREAVRCRYLALVTDLAERGIVEDVPGRTVGELDGELAVTAPQLAPEVARAGAVFTMVVYGRRTAGPDEARQVADAARRVGLGARRRAPAIAGSPT